MDRLRGVRRFLAPVAVTLFAIPNQAGVDEAMCRRSEAVH